MDNHIADVMVHVNEIQNEELLLNLEDESRGDRGVVSVGHNPGRLNLLMVAYYSAVAHPISFV